MRKVESAVAAREKTSISSVLIRRKRRLPTRQHSANSRSQLDPFGFLRGGYIEFRAPLELGKVDRKLFVHHCRLLIHLTPSRDCVREVGKKIFRHKLLPVDQP